MRLTKEQVAAEVKKVMDGDFYCFYVSPKRTKRFVSLIGSNEHGDIERVVTTIYNMLKVIYTNEDKASSLFPLYYYVDMDISKIFPRYSLFLI
jgi:hypothetical protein